MANYNPGIKSDIAAGYINSKFAEQKWYQENANFITTVGGFIATVLAWLAAQPFAEDPKIQSGVLIVGFVLTALGVKKTPNGFSKSQVKKVNAQVADHIDNTNLVVEEQRPSGFILNSNEEEPEEFTSETLDQMVSDFNRLREM